jgi:aldehyde:ferredoxin oxidoreductase
MSLEAGFGWAGSILRIDLSTGRCWREGLPRLLREEYLGGRGLAVRLMRDYFRLDPFDSGMPLIFACGPLCGTSAPASDQLSVLSRSPLTGTLFDCPVSGNFPRQLKAAGIDVLMIEGCSSSPVCITITADRVEIIPAEDLWGADIPETQSRLSGLGSVAAIGPAGENGVLFAGISVGQKNLPGRGGLGAVMGRKKLKAIAVSGERKTGIADQVKFDKAAHDIRRLFNASQFLTGPLGVSGYGTSVLVDLLSQRRMTPAYNFRETYFRDSKKYSASAIKSLINVRSGEYQQGCQPFCDMVDQDGNPLPEYEALSHFGALNGINDPTAVLEANRVCSRMGMDPVSAAATLSAWGEIRGRFVSVDELPGLLLDMAHCREDGRLLSRGAQRVAAEMGRPELSMTVKSLELPAYDPRGAYGMALSYCTSTRGGCDRQAFTLSHEILRKPVPIDRFSFSGKARIVAISENINAAADSMAFCRFALLAAGLEEYAVLLSAATGVDYSALQLTELGAKVWLSEHYCNRSNGFAMTDDLLPVRFFNEPGSSGEGIDIPPLDFGRFQEELAKYYRIRGLNREGGFDDAAFLERLP